MAKVFEGRRYDGISDTILIHTGTEQYLQTIRAEAFGEGWTVPDNQVDDNGKYVGPPGQRAGQA